MEPDLVEHVARLLEAEPTRSLRADVLYRRMPFGTTRDVSPGRFVEAVRERGDRFTVVTPASLLEDGAAWSYEERVEYAVALAAAGDDLPIVTLSNRQPDLLPHPPVPRPPAVACGGTVLSDVHDALAHLLEYTDDTDEDGMRGAIACAVDELHSVADALR